MFSLVKKTEIYTHPILVYVLFHICMFDCIFNINIIYTFHFFLKQNKNLLSIAF